MAISPPRITARRGGRAIKKNIAQHPLFARTGWFSDRWDKEHHPGGVHKEASRHFLGDAATPPRGDARRGIRPFQNMTPNHIPLSRPRWARLSTTSATLTWTDVARRRGKQASSILLHSLPVLIRSAVLTCQGAFSDRVPSPSAKRRPSRRRYR